MGSGGGGDPRASLQARGAPARMQTPPGAGGSGVPAIPGTPRCLCAKKLKKKNLRDNVKKCKPPLPGRGRACL
jgi:hypothetical protein